MAMLVLVVSIPLLVRLGWERAITGGGGVDTAQPGDPSAPGYRAVVSATPTMLVVHRGPDGSLAGLNLLALAGDEGGGAVMTIPVSMVADAGAASPRTLAEVYRSGGVGELVDVLGSTLRMGFTQVVTADPRDWEAVVGAGTTITVDNPDELADPDGEVLFEAGEVTLGAADVEPYLRLSKPGEEERSRLYRHQLLWEAWMDQRSSAGGATPTTAAADNPFATMLTDLARGPVEVVELPVQTASPELQARMGPSATGTGEAAGPVYVIDEDVALRALARIVPLPHAGHPGDRIRVRLLNGFGDTARTLQVSTVLVPAGAEIAVFGNADRFDYETSEVEYYDEAQRPAAEALATVLGVTSTSYNPAGDTSVDVSIVVGRDLARPGALPTASLPASAGRS